MSPSVRALSLRMLRRRLITPVNRLIYRFTMNPDPRSSTAFTSQTITLPHLPELYKSNFLDILLPAPAEDPVATIKNAPPALENPIMSALEDIGNQVRTENDAPALRSTKSPLLDAFHRAAAYQLPAEIGKLFEAAWEEDPEITLRIIFYLRSIHDGKSDRRLFYKAWSWLYANHPRTAIGNLHKLVEPVCERKLRKGDERQLPGMSHGYWKDLLNILCLVATNRLGLSVHYNNLWGSRGWKLSNVPSRQDQQNDRYQYLCKKLSEDPKFKALYIAVARLFVDQLASDASLQDKLESTTDPNVRSELNWQISLAGKWAPTPGCSHDRITNISTAISQLLHSSREPQSWIYPSSLSNFDHTEPLSVEQARTLRSYLQRWFLQPLRAQSKCPEPLMSANKWSSINYSHVPSVCMSNNSKRFMKHDYERFSKYMFDVSIGKKTIAGATLLPHEILMRLMEYDMDLNLVDKEKAEKEDGVDRLTKNFLETQIAVASAQWNTLVDRLRQSGSIENSIAICDVSGSMGVLNEYKGRKDPMPLFPALAMSILLATLAKPPFDKGFITFSANPEYVKLNELAGMANNMRKMVGTSWSMNTDLQKVFTELLLPLAKKHNVKKEDMIKRLFVFSDMQFDLGTVDYYNKLAGEKWGTTYDTIKKEYEAAGYDVPEIVYWDLGKADTVEVNADREGVAMMKGFSAGMMKVFLGEQEGEEDATLVDIGCKEEGDSGVVGGIEAKKEAMTPIGIMKKAVMNKSFDGLVVLD
ncbi:hypothetical protein TWF106_002961 [Orbilia oligospora]|uniref:TROVE domain-containing protein n=1 Tax=Orbilia oligospora TaxID=2813651 RepID=A0A7C8USJ3_ORBOL|nr:hypothetical protein TWF106_002961 [Orbilia oligospora]